jgi:hypothetical protein
MKFTTTKNKSYRHKIGYVPKPWIEYTFKPYEEYEDIYKSSIIKYFYDNIKLYDWDICGDETHDFVFEDGKAFRLEYSWWSEWYHEDDEKNGLKDEYDITEISIEEATVPEKKVGRNWI